MHLFNLKIYFLLIKDIMFFLLKIINSKAKVITKFIKTETKNNIKILFPDNPKIEKLNS